MFFWKQIFRPRSFCAKSGAVFLSLLFMTAVPLSAQLEWETTTINSSLTLDQDQSEAVFRFENTGSYPVSIRSTTSSCGCTTAELEQKTYKPGEKGEITARFEVGGRTGNRRNTVQVHTDDPSAPTTTLTYAVEIPSLVTITPRIQQWRRGAASDEKSIAITVNPEANVKITGVEGEDENFEATLVEGDNPHEYRLSVRPRHTNSVGRAVFALQTEPKVKNQANFSIYAFVR